MRSPRVRPLLITALMVVLTAGLVPTAHAVSTPVVTAVGPISGSPDGNTVVTIRGTGFTGASHVLFRPAGWASFRVNSDTSITAIAPPYTGSADVIVYADHFSLRSKITAGDRFTYIRPIISSVTPSAGNLAGGNTITIRGVGLRGARLVAFEGTQGSPSFRVNSDTSITAVVPRSQVPGTTNIVVHTGNSGTDSSPGSRYTWLAESSSLKVTSVSPSIGPAIGGQTVTISGAGFVNVNRVQFGAAGDARSFKVNSSSSITAVTPWLALGSVDVIVHVRNGSAHSLISASDVYSYVPPVVSKVSATSGPLSGGRSVTITGSGFIHVSRVGFGNGDAPSFTVNSPTSITAVVPPGREAGTVDVGVTVRPESYGGSGISNDIAPASTYTYVE